MRFGLTLSPSERKYGALGFRNKSTVPPSGRGTFILLVYTHYALFVILRDTFAYFRIHYPPFSIDLTRTPIVCKGCCGIQIPLGNSRKNSL